MSTKCDAVSYNLSEKCILNAVPYKNSACHKFVSFIQHQRQLDYSDDMDEENTLKAGKGSKGVKSSSGANGRSSRQGRKDKGASSDGKRKNNMDIDQGMRESPGRGGASSFVLCNCYFQSI
jgi:hypothetical protein